ncbi:Hypothetical_protein [Hexamita inflata]|uniref:Hypothetical_protein n=1 Tax=Hexamita inflata TaxID=28002 RepID=A0AA86PXR0_9EUKA|nr:Hypothetical protein HINF_LOCUS4617 [Hexamita inflata]CAI9945723.1 Hypothetical protein HINF_LOCUS33368 [Hexamita inflata]
MQYLKTQNVIELCENTCEDFDEVILYLDSKNKRINKKNKYNPQQVNLKVLAIVMLKDNKFVNSLEIQNNNIYTLKNIHEKLVNSSLIKVHIEKEFKQFKLPKTGEMCDFYPQLQYKVSDKEQDRFNLLEIQKEYSKVIIDKEISFDE